MKATAFEFRNRSWIIAAIFVAAFSLYALGDENVVLALLGWLHRWPAIDQVAAARTVFGLGAFLALLCAALRTWAAAYLRSRVVHDRDLHSAALVADGPYRHVRNPLYLGGILLSFAFVPLAGRFGAVLLVLAMATFVCRLIAREESELLASQGDSFRRYCETVPRLLPSLAPRIPCSGNRPGWLQAALGEAMMWGFFLALAGFALTLSPRVYGTGVGLALASSVVVKSRLWRRQGPGAGVTS
ncbi:MAG TPA: isoprenylcysteine carboxylmethyltransferase family protein [Vicinamibacteria bacterium]|nr:isoprenylcysteine carboxylmethyltransferase family protein [Vicinamibacteria bacterium]